MVELSFTHTRAIELRKQAEAQCEKMRENWLAEKQRREAAESRAWALEKELKALSPPEVEAENTKEIDITS